MLIDTVAFRIEFCMDKIPVSDRWSSGHSETCFGCVSNEINSESRGCVCRWHQIESLVSKEPVDRDFSTSTLSCDSSAAEIPPVTVSVNFWYKGSPFQQQIGSTLSAQQRISVMRNIEKMLGVVLGSTEEVGVCHDALVLRYIGKNYRNCFLI